MNDFDRGMWEVLKHRLPSKIRGSLHVREEIYKDFDLKQDVSFHVFFENSSSEPIHIDIFYEHSVP